MSYEVFAQKHVKAVSNRFLLCLYFTMFRKFLLKLGDSGALYE